MALNANEIKGPSGLVHNSSTGALVVIPMPTTTMVTNGLLTDADGRVVVK